MLVADPTQMTMAGALGAFQGHYATDIPLLGAGTILILLPTLIVFAGNQMGGYGDGRARTLTVALATALRA